MEICKFCGFDIADNQPKIARYSKKKKKTKFYHRECYQIKLLEKLLKLIDNINDESGHMRTALEDMADEEDEKEQGGYG